MARIPKKLYEDDDVLVISKPPHLPVQPTGCGRDSTLTDWIKENYPTLRKVGKDETKGGCGIVHRLDRETSGVMVIAKNDAAYKILKSQFQDGHVEKTYHALVYGKLTPKSGTIDAPIGRSKRSPVRRTTRKEDVSGRMRPAITHYKVIKSRNEVSLVEIRPETGRTHQIRVHFAHLRHPIVSDSMYASKKPQLLGLKRAALHAVQITITLPSSKEPQIFEAPYPPDMEKALS